MSTHSLASMFVSKFVACMRTGRTCSRKGRRVQMHTGDDFWQLLLSPWATMLGALHSMVLAPAIADAKVILMHTYAYDMEVP